MCTGPFPEWRRAPDPAPFYARGGSGGTASNHTAGLQQRLLHVQVVLQAEVGGLLARGASGELTQFLDLQRLRRQVDPLPVVLTAAVHLDRLNVLVGQVAAPQVGNDTCALRAVDLDPPGVWGDLDGRHLDDAPGV